MAYDFITHAKRIEEQLKLSGLSEAAERLIDARLGGATSGEILTAMRFVLSNLISSGSIAGQIKADAVSLIAEINRSGI